MDELVPGLVPRPVPGLVPVGGGRLTTAMARSAPSEAQLRTSVRTPNTIILQRKTGIMQRRTWNTSPWQRPHRQGLRMKSRKAQALGCVHVLLAATSLPHNSCRVLTEKTIKNRLREGEKLGRGGGSGGGGGEKFPLSGVG